MGHSWREMDPEGAAADDEFMDQLLRLREKLFSMRLDKFTASDLPAICRVIEPFGNPTRDDLEILEARLRELENEA